jgi:hypothetical protein
MVLLKKESEILILSILLIATTFIGVPLNGGDKGWIYINWVFREFVMRNKTFEYTLVNVFVLVFTFILYTLPLYIKSIYRKQIFIVIPLFYFIVVLLSFPFFIHTLYYNLDNPYQAS